jgi:hypothetical protein
MRLGAAILVAAGFAIAAALGAGGALRNDGTPPGHDGTARDHGTARDRAAPAAVERVAPGTLLERTYMGVACPRPNSIACDRVGLAVWLRDEATAVSAEIDGRRFELDDPEWADWPRGFAGYLQPAGLRDGALRVPARGDRWLGYGEVSARVRLRVTRGDGVRVTEVDVPLRAGWG